MLRAMPCPCLTCPVPKSRAERCLNKTPVWIQVETRSTPAFVLFRANRKSGSFRPLIQQDGYLRIDTSTGMTHKAICQWSHQSQQCSKLLIHLFLKVFIQKSLRGDYSSQRIISQTNLWTLPYSHDGLKESLLSQPARKPQQRRRQHVGTW